MNFLENINEFLTNKDIKVSQKVSIILVVIVVAFIINDSTGFTYSYEMKNKISQMESLNKIISDANTDSVGKDYALNLRKEVYYRKTFTQSIFDHIDEINWSKIKTGKVDNSNLDSNNYNDILFWYHITSSFVYYLAGIIMFPAVLFLAPRIPFIQRLASALIGSGVCIILGLFLYLICTLIPIISEDYPVINYAINIIIQSLSLYGLRKINSFSKRINI